MSNSVSKHPTYPQKEWLNWINNLRLFGSVTWFIIKTLILLILYNFETASAAVWHFYCIMIKFWVDFDILFYEIINDFKFPVNDFNFQNKLKNC